MSADDDDRQPFLKSDPSRRDDDADAATPNDVAAAHTASCAAIFDAILLIVLVTLILPYVCENTVSFPWWRIVHVVLAVSALVARANPRFYSPVWFAVLAFFALLADAFLAGEQWARLGADPFVAACALWMLVVAVAFVIVDVIYLSALSLALRRADFVGEKPA